MTVETMHAPKTDRYSTINWITFVAMSAFHVGAVAALFYFSWTAVALTAFFYWVSIGLGIGMGYHRLHTHRSYKVPKLLEYFFAICGTLTLEGGPIFWVATHRIHQNRERHWVPLTVFGFAVLALGGWPMVLWLVFFRVTVGLHSTWLVNSATHMWGSRRFQTKDDSKNSWWVAILTFGEGWHNNHHAHPTSARHGLAWYELDVSWITIRMMRAIGLAKRVRVATADGYVRKEAA